RQADEAIAEHRSAPAPRKREIDRHLEVVLEAGTAAVRPLDLLHDRHALGIRETDTEAPTKRRPVRPRQIAFADRRHVRRGAEEVLLQAALEMTEQREPADDVEATSFVEQLADCHAADSRVRDDIASKIASIDIADDIALRLIPVV